MSNSYETSLACLCKQSARLSLLKDRLLAGEEVSELPELLQIMEFSKEKLLLEKEKLGYSDGLAFMEDNNFRGFSVREGQLFGDTQYLLRICMPWYENAKNNYQYEVANYLIALYLAHHPDALETKNNPINWVVSTIKNIFFKKRDA